jgi:hypothetical protein
MTAIDLREKVTVPRHTGSCEIVERILHQDGRRQEAQTIDDGLLRSHLLLVARPPPSTAGTLRRPWQP